MKELKERGIIIPSKSTPNRAGNAENKGINADMLFDSEKAREIIESQTPMDDARVHRVRECLASKGIVLEQSVELDQYLISNGKEAITFSDGTMVMHTKVSASGFYEELIHYGQIRSGRVKHGDEGNRLMLEIEAQERLLKCQKAYKITEYEVGVLTENLNQYKLMLERLLGRR